MSASLLVAVLALCADVGAADVDTVAEAVAANANAVVDVDAKDADFFAYYDGEFAGATGVVVAGAASMAVGAAFLFVDDDFVKGAGGALLIGGGLAGAGFALYMLLIPGMVEDGLARFEKGPAGFVAAEQARMGPVIERFTPLRLTTAALTLAGLLTCFLGKAVDNDVVAGAGLGASVTTFSLFIYDSAAAGRGRDYLAALNAE